jgi:hypothetical protein
VQLTSVAALKRYLRLDTDQSKDDGLCQLLVSAANDAITSAISRNLLSDQYTEVRDGTGTRVLMLSNTPVTAIGALAFVGPQSFVNGPLPTTPLRAGVDFTFTPYSVKLYCGVFPRGTANVSIEYTAGYTAIPADIIHATTKWAALRYRELERIGQESKTIGGETVTFDLAEMPPDILGIVTRYQTKIPLVAQPTGLV